MTDRVRKKSWIASINVTVFALQIVVDIIALQPVVAHIQVGIREASSNVKATNYKTLP